MILSIDLPPTDPVARALWHLEIGYHEAEPEPTRTCEQGCNGCEGTYWWL